MVKKSFVPERGDLVWLDFDPQTGHEQSGKRPALVISPKDYNEKVGLGLFCPITSKEKGYPFETRIESSKIKGVVLSDQIKSLDWKARNAEFAGKANSNEIDDVIEKLRVLIIEKS